MKRKNNSAAVVLVLGVLLFIGAVTVAAAGLTRWARGRAELPLRLEPAASCPPEKLAGPEVEGLVLPDVTGLGGPAGAGIDVPAGQPERIPRVTVLVDRRGAARVEGLDHVGQWRGTELPRDYGPAPGSAWDGQLDEVVVVVFQEKGAAGVQYRINRWKTGSVRTLAAQLAELAQIGEFPLVIDAGPEVPFGPVAAVVAAAERLGFEVEFRPPPAEINYRANPAVRGCLMRESAERRAPTGLAEVGVRIRADARAPWKSVAGVLVVCMEARIWRVAFGAHMDGLEVSLGRLTAGGPPGRKPRGVRPYYDVKKKRDIFKSPEPVVEKPVAIR